MIAASRRMTCSVLMVLPGVDYMRRGTFLNGLLKSRLMTLNLHHNLLVRAHEARLHHAGKSPPAPSRPDRQALDPAALVEGPWSDCYSADALAPVATAGA